MVEANMSETYMSENKCLAKVSEDKIPKDDNCLKQFVFLNTHEVYDYAQCLS